MVIATPGDVRVRRGLFNIIGEISNKLVGTATEREVEESRVRIASVRKLNHRITHLVNQLVTVVNQTHNQVKQNYQHIREFEQYIMLVAREIHLIHLKMRGRVNYLRYLQQHGVDHRHTTPVHPQSDGSTERFNRTLKSMLEKLVNNNIANWDDRLG